MKKIDPSAKIITAYENFIRVLGFVSAKADLYGIVSMDVSYTIIK